MSENFSGSRGNRQDDQGVLQKYVIRDLDYTYSSKLFSNMRESDQVHRAETKTQETHARTPNIYIYR